MKWDNVTAWLAAGNYAHALLAIKPFVQQLQAQSGKKVSVAVATELQLDAAAVYHYALCQAVALAQIGPGTHSADYAWYAALVTGLGGTPLPDC